MSSEKLNLSHLKPKYWLSWLVVALSWLLAILPSSWQAAISRWLASRLASAKNNRLGTIRRNIERCFPEKTTSERDQLVQDNVESSLLMVFGLVNMVWRTPTKMTDNVDVIGEQYLKQAIEDERGLLLVSGHFTPLCQMFTKLAMLEEYSSMYRRMDNPVLEQQIYQRGIKKYSLKLIHRKNVRDMLDKLVAKEAVAVLPDQDFGVQRGCFVSFFGIQTATITSIPQYARQTGAQVLMFSAYRENGRCVMTFEPALTNYPSADDVVDTQYWSDWLEAKIRQHPADYLWMHKRFKTRPDGEANFYK